MIRMLKIANSNLMVSLLRNEKRLLDITRHI